MYPGSGGSRSRPSDLDSGKSTFMSGAPTLASSSFKGYVYRVTLCRWPAKQTIPLSVLARNQTKGFGLEISPCPEVVTGRKKSRKKELEGSWRGTTDKGSRHRTAERPVE